MTPASVEAWWQPKHRASASLGEDLVGWSGEVYWLLDGASTPARRVLPGNPAATGALVASWTDLAFRVTLAHNPAAPLEELLDAADFAVGEHLRAMHPGATREALYADGPHTTVVLVRVLPDRLDYALLQDSSLLVWSDGSGVLTQLKDRRQDRFNCEHYTAVAAALRDADAFGPRYNRILDEMVDRERLNRNKPEGFATLTGLGTAAALAEYGSLPLGVDATILLASDGAARLWDVFGCDAQAGWVMPLARLSAHVRGFEQEDPNGLRYPRIGASDDIAYLRIRRGQRPGFQQTSALG